MRTKTTDIHKPPELDNAASNMARLRATPGSGKRRLVLAGLPQNGSCEAAASRSHNEREHNDEIKLTYSYN
jgi:bloom syndrome protein